MPGPIEAAAMRAALLQQLDGPSAPASESAQGPQPGIGPWPYAALVGGQGADALTTMVALRQPGFREGNPLGAKGALLGKAALTPLMALAMKRLAAGGHPTAAKVLGYGVGAAGAVPAALNVRTMRK